MKNLTIKILVLIALLSPAVGVKAEDPDETPSHANWKEGTVDESRSSDEMREDAEVSDEEWNEHRDDARTDIEEEDE